MTNFTDTTYTITEVAQKINLSDKTLRRWEEAGRFTPSRTEGNQRRYNMEDLQILDAIKHNSIPDQKDLLTKDQAAALLGVTNPTIDRFVAEGKIHPFITVGHTYYPRHRLIDKLAELTPPKPTYIPLPKPTTNTGILENRSTEKLMQATPLSVPKLSYSKPYTQYAIQISITLILILGYHLLFNQGSTPISPSPTGQVQGVATSPSLALLDDMLDPSTGSISVNSLTSKLGISSPNLTLLPGIAPTSPMAGSLYFDGTDNTLKIYTPAGWITLATTSELENLKIDLQSLSESKVATSSPTP